MISTRTKIDVTIDDVSEIRITPVTDRFFTGKQRFITVETSYGEIYCLRLNSQDAEKLVIREVPDVEDNWLTPKVYRGKDMSGWDEDQPTDE